MNLNFLYFIILGSSARARLLRGGARPGTLHHRHHLSGLALPRKDHSLLEWGLGAAPSTPGGVGQWGTCNGEQRQQTPPHCSRAGAAPALRGHVGGLRQWVGGGIRHRPLRRTRPTPEPSHQSGPHTLGASSSSPSGGGTGTQGSKGNFFSNHYSYKSFYLGVLL
jgi:hypothetical protein